MTKVCEFYHSAQDYENGVRVYNFHVYSPIAYGAVLDISHLVLNDEANNNMVNLLDRIWTSRGPRVIRNLGTGFKGENALEEALAFVRTEIESFVTVYGGVIKDCDGLEEFLNRPELWNDDENPRQRDFFKE